LNDAWKFDGEQWVWVSGSNVINQKGEYGQLRIPNSDNIPSARYNAVSWMDNSGNMWMFGGLGYDYSGHYIGNVIHDKYK
jgi:hypothetical protein